MTYKVDIWDWQVLLIGRLAGRLRGLACGLHLHRSRCQHRGTGQGGFLPGENQRTELRKALSFTEVALAGFHDRAPAVGLSARQKESWPLFSLGSAGHGTESPLKWDRVSPRFKLRYLHLPLAARGFSSCAHVKGFYMLGFRPLQRMVGVRRVLHLQRVASACQAQRGRIRCPFSSPFQI